MRRRIYDPHAKRYRWEEVPVQITPTSCPFNGAVDCDDYATEKCGLACGWHPAGHARRVEQIKEARRHADKICI